MVLAMTELETADLLTYLAAAYPLEVDAMIIAVWSDVLEDVDVELAQTIAREVVKAPGCFAPSPGDFRAMCLERKRQTQKRLAQRAQIKALQHEPKRIPDWKVREIFSRFENKKMEK